jgi:hypothetical protein
MRLNFPVIRRYWDDVNDCEPTYPVPSIVWWFDAGKGGYKGEYLTEQYPNGEVVVSSRATLDELIEQLIEREFDLRTNFARYS